MHPTKSILPLGLTLVLAAAALAGCTANASGTAAIYVKDAPSDAFTHLYVSFTKAELHQLRAEPKDTDANETGDEASGHDDKNETESEKNAEGNSGKGRQDGQFGEEMSADEDHGEHDGADRAEGAWITVMDRNVTVDLKAFAGNASAFLDAATLPPGTYNGIRLTVTNAVGVLANGTQVPVKVPSGALRIKGHFMVVAGKETALTLDFNLARSIVETGHGKYILKPVLRLASLERDEANDGEHRQREARRDEHDRDSREKEGRGVHSDR